MQKYKKIILTVFIGGLCWRMSQIIFSVLYSPSGSHIGVPSGSWTDRITTIGFETQQLNNLKSSVPHQITNTGLWEGYNISCTKAGKSCKAFRGQDVFSSLQRLQTIQYVAQDIDIQKPSDLTNRIHQINNYNPQRMYPYVWAQYIGPSSKHNNSDTGLNQLTRINSISIGEQGIAYSCDADKIEKISKLDYKSFIKAIETHDPTYRYPCPDGELARNLAFNYYYYLNNTVKSSLYYMVASFHDDTPLITLSMPAIIIGREGEHKTSALLRYERVNSASAQLKQAQTDKEIADIQSTIDKSLKEMVSEYSFFIINEAMQGAQSDGRPLSCQHSLSCLQDNNYITNAINNNKKKCDSDPILCEILQVGKEYGRISEDGGLIYPSDTTMMYSRDEEKGQWWIAKK